jgi:hypothetical protein
MAQTKQLDLCNSVLLEMVHLDGHMTLSTSTTRCNWKDVHHALRVAQLHNGKHLQGAPGGVMVGRTQLSLLVLCSMLLLLLLWISQLWLGVQYQAFAPFRVHEGPTTQVESHHNHHHLTPTSSSGSLNSRFGTTCKLKHAQAPPPPTTAALPCSLHTCCLHARDEYDLMLQTPCFPKIFELTAQHGGQALRGSTHPHIQHDPPLSDPPWDPHLSACP